MDCVARYIGFPKDAMRCTSKGAVIVLRRRMIRDCVPWTYEYTATRRASAGPR